MECRIGRIVGVRECAFFPWNNGGGASEELGPFWNGFFSLGKTREPSRMCGFAAARAPSRNVVIP